MSPLTQGLNYRSACDITHTNLNSPTKAVEAERRTSFNKLLATDLAELFSLHSWNCGCKSCHPNQQYSKALNC